MGEKHQVISHKPTLDLINSKRIEKIKYIFSLLKSPKYYESETERKIS